LEVVVVDVFNEEEEEELVFTGVALVVILDDDDDDVCTLLVATDVELTTTKASPGGCLQILTATSKDKFFSKTVNPLSSVPRFFGHARPELYSILITGLLAAIKGRYAAHSLY